MKTLFKLIFFIIFPFLVNGQISTLQTGTNKLFLESFSDTITSSVSARHSLALSRLKIILPFL